MAAKARFTCGCGARHQTCVNLTAALTHGIQELVNFVCDKGCDPIGARSNMSELSTAVSNSASSPSSSPCAASDDHALAQVEKWMAMIREMDSKPREGRNEPSKEAATSDL